MLVAVDDANDPLVPPPVGWELDPTTLFELDMLQLVRVMCYDDVPPFEPVVRIPGGPAITYSIKRYMEPPERRGRVSWAQVTDMPERFSCGRICLPILLYLAILGYCPAHNLADENGYTLGWKAQIKPRKTTGRKRQRNQQEVQHERNKRGRHQVR